MKTARIIVPLLLATSLASLESLAHAQLKSGPSGGTARSNQAAQAGQQAASPAEQAEMRRQRIQPAEVRAFLAWYRGGRKAPAVNMDAVVKGFPNGVGSNKTNSNPCLNGDWELGNFSNWTFSQAYCNSGTAMWYYSGSSPIDTALPETAQHALIGPHAGVAWSAWNFTAVSGSINLANASWNGGTDPIVALGSGTLPIPFPNGGTKTLRLGNPGASNGSSSATNPIDGEGASYAFTVTPSNQNFRFRYAVVLEDGGHGGGNPAFNYILWAPNFMGVYKPIDSFTKIANTADSFFQSAFGPWVWRRVSCYSFNIPAQYVGKTLIATFMTHDCLFNYHAGYAYVDGLCDPDVGKPVLNVPKTTVCEHDPVMVDGSGSSDEISHTWTLEQCSASGSAVPGTAVSQTQQTIVGPAFDIGAWYRAQGKAMPCGKYYKVTLSITTECGTSSVSKVIFYDCCSTSGGDSGAGDCCEGTPLSMQSPAKLKALQKPGDYSFTSTLTWGGTAARIDATISNVVRAEGPGYAPTPGFGYVLNTSPMGTPPLTPVTPNLLFPRVARWDGFLPSSGPAPMQMSLRFPPPAPGKDSYLKFTLKVVKTAPLKCVTCEVYQTFACKFDPNGNLTEIDPKDFPRPAITNGGVIKGGEIGDPVAFPGQTGPGKMLENPVATRAGAAQAKSGLSPIPEGDWVWPTGPAPNPHLLNCCGPQPGAIRRADLRMMNGTTSYAFSPVLNAPVSFPLVTRVEIAMINAAGATANSLTYPIFGYQSGSPSIPSFPTVQNPVTPFSHITAWKSAAAAGNAVLNTGFPMSVVFPPPPVGGASYVHFTMRYTFYTRECKECSIYEKYYFKMVRGQNPTPINPKDWPVKLNTGGGPGDPPPNKLRGRHAMAIRRNLPKRLSTR